MTERISRRKAFRGTLALVTGVTLGWIAGETQERKNVFEGLHQQGLSEFVNLYRELANFEAIFRVPVFPEVYLALEKVGLGTASSETINLYKDDWRKERITQEVVDKAHQKTEQLKIIPFENQDLSYPRRLFYQFASIFPVSILLMPNTVYLGRTSPSISREYVNLGYPLEEDPESWFVILLHETNHLIDPYMIDSQKISVLKRFSRKEDFIYYVQTYLNAISQNLMSMAATPLGPDTSSSIRFGMEAAVSKQKRLEEALTKVALIMGLPPDQEELKLTTSDYISYHLVSRLLKNPKDPLFNTQEARIVLENLIPAASHFFVDPFYRLCKEILADPDFNLYGKQKYLLLAQLDEVRMRMIAVNPTRLDQKSLGL